MNSFPNLRSRFIIYGPRGQLATSSQKQGTDENGRKGSGNSITELKSRYGSNSTSKPPGGLAGSPGSGRMAKSQEPHNTILDAFSTVKVPHQWFMHFYIVSVASSVFWGIQIFTGGPFLRAFHSIGKLSAPENTMSVDQVVVTWIFMAVQGIRRLSESFLTNKSSSSKISFAHWLLGISFYLAMGVSIWIEGIGTLYSYFYSKKTYDLALA